MKSFDDSFDAHERKSKLPDLDKTQPRARAVPLGRPLRGMPDSLDDMSGSGLKLIEAQAIANQRNAGLAWTMFEALKEQIEAFAKKLDDSHEVGVMLLTNFGPSGVLHIESVGYQDPHLIVMKGVLNRETVTLLQHVSQVSILLQAVKATGEKKRVIGYQTEPNDG